MPALLPLFYDVVNKRLVLGINSPDPFTIPTLYQEDSYTIDFTALLPTGNQFNPIYSRLNLASYSLQISVGNAGVPLAIANAWTPSADLQMLSGVLQLNTAGMNGLDDGARVTFEIRLFDGTNYNRGQQVVTFRKSVGTTGALVPPASDTALGSLEAKRTYARKEGLPGEPIILTGLDGSQIQLTCDAGALREERIA
jgi:hypothetical protein